MKYDYPFSTWKQASDYGVSSRLLKDIFYRMLRIRRIEEAIESRYHEDELKTPIHLVIGQEATAVGACAALQNSDLVYASHRTHGVYLAKGGDLTAMLAEFFCRKAGCAGSRGGSMHLLDQNVGMVGSSAICGGNVPIATGMALSGKLLKEKRVSICFFGDGAAEEGVVWESLNFAALKKLPVIFFCENNFFSVFTPLHKRQPSGSNLWEKAAAFGVKAELVDGTHPLEVYSATKRAVQRARQHEGPTFIEAKVYRWRAHGGAGDDNHKGYRDAEELKAWQRHCPVESFYQFLLEKGELDTQEKSAMEQEIRAEFEIAFNAARRLPNPQPSDLYNYVFHD